MPNTNLGIYYPDDTTNITPLQTVLGAMSSSVDAYLAANATIHTIANTAARAALVAAYSPTTSKPLFAWRQDASAGQNLEYTTNGSTWFKYSSEVSSGFTTWVNTATQTITTGFAVLNIATLDTGVSLGTNSAGAITLSATGVYKVIATVYWDPITTLTRRGLTVTKNCTSISGGGALSGGSVVANGAALNVFPIASGLNITQTVNTGHFSATAGDVLRVFGFTDATSSVVLVGSSTAHFGQTHLTVIRVS